MKELESHHLATIIVIIHSDKKHQWILKLLGGNKRGRRFCMVSKYLLRMDLLITEGKTKQVTVEKSGRHHLNQVVKYHQIVIICHQA